MNPICVECGRKYGSQGRPGYPPFCTLKCALVYARRAHEWVSKKILGRTT